MNKKVIYNIIIIAGLVIAVSAVMILKNGSENNPVEETLLEEENQQRQNPEISGASNPAEENSPEKTQTSGVEENKSLPTLIDLGSDTCVPCKMMEPILEDLQENYADQFGVTFINVRENRQAGKQYGIRVIPTQIFYDASGEELFRHEGFFSKEDILSKWEELGVEIEIPKAEENE